MHAFTPAILPNPRVWFERALCCQFAKRLDRMKQGCIAGVRKSAIKEHRRRSHNDTAVHVVLALIDSGVTDTDRSVSAVAGKSRRSPFLEWISVHHTVERPDLFSPAGGDAQDITYEILH